MAPPPHVQKYLTRGACVTSGFSQLIGRLPMTNSDKPIRSHPATCLGTMQASSGGWLSLPSQLIGNFVIEHPVCDIPTQRESCFRYCATRGMLLEKRLAGRTPNIHSRYSVHTCWGSRVVRKRSHCMPRIIAHFGQRSYAIFLIQVQLSISFRYICGALFRGGYRHCQGFCGLRQTVWILSP